MAYVNQAVVNSFAKKYKCKVQVTTFNTMDEAMSKLRSGLRFDVLMGATVDVIGQLIEGKLVQPLNHSYIPNITQAWPDFTNPFYDQGWQYTVPYTIYTTGISWRKDLVNENPYTMANPWAMPWQSKYKGRVAILDDYRESISLGLMKNGIFDLNTTDYRQINLAGQIPRGPVQPGQRPHRQQRLHRDPHRRHLDPPRLVRRHGLRAVLHAQGRERRRGRLLVPDRRQGPVANDTNIVLSSATNPVLAHEYLNYFLDLPQRHREHQLQRLHAAAHRRDAAGPGQGADPAAQSLTVHGGAAVLLPPRRGPTPASVDVDALWQQAWLVVSNGI